MTWSKLLCSKHLNNDRDKEYYKPAHNAPMDLLQAKKVKSVGTVSRWKVGQQ